jgi:hypothetical protein
VAKAKSPASAINTKPKAVGVAMKKGGEGVSTLTQATTQGLDEDKPPEATAGAKSAGLGISAAGTLARLTSHSR